VGAAQILAKNLQRLREKRGLKLSALAKSLNLSVATISRWESAHALPDQYNIDAICRLFGITPGELFSDDMGQSPISKPVKLTITEAIKIINEYEGLLSIKIRRNKKK
jgi:transcriptional regulator with XRE-family HTH domain